MARADLGNVWVAATESGPVTVASAIVVAISVVVPEHKTWKTQHYNSK